MSDFTYFTVGLIASFAALAASLAAIVLSGGQLLWGLIFVVVFFGFLFGWRFKKTTDGGFGSANGER
jgi:uncharacterized SAM-binding protein YcdF (DUF218 family)